MSAASPPVAVVGNLNLDIRTSPIPRSVGQDELGRRLCAFLESNGAHVHAAWKPVATGRSIALTRDTHQRHFISSLPHARLLEESDIDLDELHRAGFRAAATASGWLDVPAAFLLNSDLPLEERLHACAPRLGDGIRGTSPRL